jgi:chemotaxis protein histidine kinase CheA
VEAHGGTISVTSKPGEGAVFVVDLPLRTQIEDSVLDRDRGAAVRPRRVI